MGCGASNGRGKRNRTARFSVDAKSNVSTQTQKSPNPTHFGTINDHYALKSAFEQWFSNDGTEDGFFAALSSSDTVIGTDSSTLANFIMVLYVQEPSVPLTPEQQKLEAAQAVADEKEAKEFSFLRLDVLRKRADFGKRVLDILLTKVSLDDEDIYQSECQLLLSTRTAIAVHLESKRPSIDYRPIKRTFGDLPLHKAAKSNNMRGIDWLVKQGQDLAEVDGVGMSVLMYAMETASGAESYLLENYPKCKEFDFSKSASYLSSRPGLKQDLEKLQVKVSS